MSDSTIRVNRRENPFTQIDRKLINDSRIGFDTRGMLIYLLDKPKDWETSLTALINQSPAGRFAVRRMIEDAEKFGYIRREDKRVFGKFKTVYEVFEFPEDSLDSPCAVSRRGKTDAGKPTRENRRGKTDAGNRTQHNTEYSNTDHTNTDQRNTHHHHVASTTIPNDDDDVLIDFDLNPHFQLSKTIAEKVTSWTGYETFLRSLNESQLIAAASWLYLWFICELPHADFVDQESQRAERNLYKAYPFAGVENIIGKIVTQSRLGNVAPLAEDHKADFNAEIRQWFDEIQKPV